MGGQTAYGSSWPSADNGPRRKIGEGRAVGVLVDWQDKGMRSHGWIAPLHGIPSGLAEAKDHGGDIYIHWQDIQEPRSGAIVTFSAYVDEQGLGAEDCRNRQVLRLVLPYPILEQLPLPDKEVNHCATYLSASVFYPDLEQDGVTLRRYIWDGSLALLELWGEKEDIISCAEQIGAFKHNEVEALISLRMSSIANESDIREITQAELPNVPPRFRHAWAFARAAGDDTAAARTSIRSLLDLQR